jgi:hypothetical protein
MSIKKLGALLRAVPPATARETAEPAPDVAPEILNPAPRPSAPATHKATPVKPPIEREVPLQVLIPANIRKQLAHKAAEEGESLRALVLRAIRSLGVTVTDAEIAGKRGQRKS